jgi:hypothetical protein
MGAGDPRILPEKNAKNRESTRRNYQNENRDEILVDNFVRGGVRVCGADIVGTEGPCSVARCGTD